MDLKRREFLAGIAAAAVKSQNLAGRHRTSSGEVTKPWTQVGSRPNILHIMPDQMQWSAICGRSESRTPNINRLAEQGIRFERSYTPSPVCCPARAMFHSGAFPWHNGIFNQNHSPESVHRDMFPNVITTFQRLKEAGYYQGYVGEWMASYLRSPLDFGVNEIAAPLAYNPRMLKGVDYNPDRVPGPMIYDERLETHVDRWFRWPGSEPFPMWGYMEGPEDATQMYWVAESGIRMMKRFAQHHRPWHLEIHFVDPHDPYMPHKEYLDRYDPAKIDVPESFHDTFQGKPGLHRRESETWGEVTEDDYRRSRAHYYAFCEQVDIQVGRILRALDETGQAENTLVTLSSDHADMVGAHRMWIKGWIPYEEAYRIPILMRWPARFKPGLVTNRLAQLHDLAHTYIDAAGAGPLPYPEGRSLLPLVDDPHRSNWPDQILCACYGAEFLYTQRIVITERYKYVFNGFDIDECYDLEKDPQEMHNRVADPGYAEVVEDMRARLYELMNQLGDPYGDVGPKLPDSVNPSRYGAARYLARGKRATK